MKIKLYLFYYKKIMRYTLPISGIIMVIYTGISMINFGSMNAPTIYSLILAFMIILFLPGTASGIYLYSRFRSHEYFFYRNKGLTLIRLVIFAAAVNLIMTAITFMILKKF